MSWGSTNLLLNGDVVGKIEDALKRWEQTGQPVSVSIPPLYTASFRKLASCGMPMRELTISSPEPVDRNTLVWIASCFGFHSTPQRWSVWSATDAGVCEVTILQTEP